MTVSDSPNATPDDIAYCFRLLLGRAPSTAERDGHSTLVGSPLQAVVRSYLDSGEFTARNRQAAERDPMLATLPGYRLYAAEDDLAVGRHVIAGTYEPEVTAVFREVLRPGMTVLDLGANIGFFTMLAASLVGPSGRVVAVEPNLANVRLLEASRRVNGFDQVSVVPCAIAAEPGMLLLQTVYSNGATSPLQETELEGALLVPGLPVSALLPRGHSIDFIKIDIEGAEHAALMSCTEMLRRDQPVIVSEFSPGLLRSNSGVGGVEYLRFLQGLGYALAVIGPDGDAQGCRSPADVMALFEAAPGDHVDLLLTPRRLFFR